MRKLKLTQPIAGAATHQVLSELLAQNPVIAAINIFRYSQPPLLQERLDILPAQTVLVEKATLLHDQIHLPFWDSLMLSLSDNCAPEFDASIFDAAVFHQAAAQFYQQLSRSEVLDGTLEMLVDEAETDPLLALSSRVVLDSGEECHIPLLDFHCSLTDRNDLLVATLTKKLFEVPCVIMNSGQSYHCIALKLVDSPSLLETLYRALLYSPIVDRAYVAHQLLERASALRLSQSKTKPNLPRFKLITDTVRNCS